MASKAAGSETCHTLVPGDQLTPHAPPHTPDRHLGTGRPQLLSLDPGGRNTAEAQTGLRGEGALSLSATDSTQCGFPSTATLLPGWAATPTSAGFSARPLRAGANRDEVVTAGAALSSAWLGTGAAGTPGMGGSRC